MKIDKMTSDIPSDYSHAAPFKMLGWFPCVQASNLKCIRSVSVCSNLPCINIGVRVKLTRNLLGGFFSYKAAF